MELTQQEERDLNNALNMPAQNNDDMSGKKIIGDFRECYDAGDVQREEPKTPNVESVDERREMASEDGREGSSNGAGVFQGQVSGYRGDADSDNNSGQQQRQQSSDCPSDVGADIDDGQDSRNSAAAAPFVFHYITKKGPGAERSTGYYLPNTNNSPRPSAPVAEENCCCVECGVTFANIDLLLKHVQVHEAEQYGSDDIYQAGASPEDSSEATGELENTVNNGSEISQGSGYGADCKVEQADATCMECGQVFDDVDTLLRHVEVMHEVIIGQNSSPQTTKRDTIQIHQQLETAAFSCPVCQQGFMDERLMRDHLKRHNSRGGMPSVSTSPSLASTPKHSSEDGPGPKADFNVFTFRRRGKKGQNDTDTTGSKPKTAHLCLICGDVFRLLSSLDTHYQMHRRSSPTSGQGLDHKCVICGKVFSKAHNLNTHMRLHNQERPYECTLCGKRFTQSSHLRQHELIHTQVRPFACRFCPKMFRQSSHLHMHERIHTGMRPYKCALCDKAFMQSSHLRIHERTHSRVRPYTCRFCNATFIQSAHMRLHEKRHLSEAGAEAGANGIHVVTSQRASPVQQNGIPMDAEPIHAQVTA